MKDKTAISFAILLFAIGHTLTWLNINAQFKWEFWRDKPILSACIYAIPTSLLFWYGTKMSYGPLEGAWGARLLGFASSYFVFPLMTYFFLGESAFEPKTFACIVLSFCIIAIQLFWK